MHRWLTSFRAPKARHSTLSLAVMALLAWLPTAEVGAQATAAADPEAGAALAVLQAHFEAFNRGDAAASSALMHDQIIYVAGPRCLPQAPCRGQAAAAQGFVNPSVAMKMRVTLGTTAERFGEAFRTRVEVTWPALEAGTAMPGVRRLVGHDMFKVVDGKVALKHFLPDATDAQTAYFYATSGGRKVEAPAYRVVEFEVIDQEAWSQYTRRALQIPSIGQHLVRAGEAKPVVGQPPVKVSVFRHASMAEALAFDQLPEVAEIKSLRDRGARTRSYIVPGTLP